MDHAPCARVLLGSVLCVFAGPLPSRAACPLRFDPLPGDVGFGVATTFLGDVNGDGFGDFAVGATKSDSSGDAVPGRVSVFFGGPARDAVADVVLVGEAAGDRFGIALAAAGDWNGDGAGDIVVGAPGNDSGGMDAGRAYLFFGGPALDSVPDVVLSGSSTGAQFGAAIAGASDLNGDGFADLVIGAPLSSYESGSAFAYFGGLGFDTVPDRTFSGAPGEHLGSTFAVGGDFNSDTHPDLAIGAPFASSETGRAYLYWGGPILDARSDRTLGGVSAGDRFGSAVALGDVNGDGAADVVVGAPRRSNNSGSAFVYYSGAWSPSLVLGPGVWGSAFGSFVAAGADLNGDGDGDLVVGAPAPYGGSPVVQIYLGGTGIDAAPDLTWKSVDSWPAFGGHGAVGPNLEADGLDEILVGAAGHALLGAPPFVRIDSVERLSADPGEVVVPRFCIRNLAGRIQQVDVQLADSRGWTEPSTMVVSLAPGDSVCLESFAALPADASCIYTSVLTCRVAHSGCIESPISHAVTLERQIPEPVMTWCDPVDSLVSVGDSLRLGFRVRNPSSATREFVYELGGASWCWRQTGTVTVAPGDSFQVARTCVVPPELQCGDAATLYARVRDACTVLPHGLGWITCYRWITVEATACAGPSCGEGFVVVAGSPVARLFRFGNCSEQQLTYDYTITDSLDWGSPLGGTVTLASGEIWEGEYTLATPRGVACPTEDPITLEVRAHSCLERPFVCTTPVYTRPPESAMPSRILEGSASDADFGVSIALPGDLDGDGHEDFVVGATDYTWDPGHANVFFGGPDEDGGVDLRLSGEGAGDAFGAVVTAAGDWNADRHPDLAIGAPLRDGGGLDRGRAYLYFGGPGFDATPERVLDGTADNARLGSAIDGVGDLNADGFSDLAVTAGEQVLLFFGGPAMDTQPDLALAGSQPYEKFGYAVARGGDLNADGWSDIAVGAPVNQAAGPDAGAVYVFFGGPNLDATVDIVCYGAGGTFGHDLTSADANGDGLTDLLVAARHFDRSAGRVEVFLGGPTFDAVADVFLQSGIDGEEFGSALAAVGDLDGDGYGDFLIGATGIYFYDYGRVWIERGGPQLGGPCDGVLVGTGGLSGFSSVLAGGRDVVGDGHADLLVGAPGDGHVYLYTDVLLAPTDLPPEIVPQSGSPHWVTSLATPLVSGSAGVRIEYTIGPAPARAQIDLFDVVGRRVRSFTQVPGDVGHHHVDWDRCDSNGHRAARGVYLVRLRADEVQVTRKIVVASP